jgi:acyl-coenzyme A synthetase/AMP-(fatty) acid ligase
MIAASPWSLADLTPMRQVWPSVRDKKFATTEILDAATSGDNLTEHVIDLWENNVIPLLIPSLGGVQFSVDHLTPPKSAVIGFVTSGTSSATPTVIWKSWNALNSEAFTLMKEFKITTSSRILTMVPPVHIFGFLYSILLPTVSGASLISSQRWDLSLFEPCPLAETADVIITVPPLWSVLERMLPFFSVGFNAPLILTSGASFGPERGGAAQKLRNRLSLGFRIVDIVGSTETGGIGFKTVAGEELEESFTLFDGVNIFPPTITDGRWSVSSPFTDDRHLEVNDVFVPAAGPRTFEYGGRSDRIVKIGARRFNLADIESALSQCANGSAVVCLFKQDPHTAKGGSMFAFVESGDLKSSDIFEAYQRRFKELPLPTNIHMSEHLPKGAMGKTSRSELEKLLTRPAPL